MIRGHNKYSCIWVLFGLNPLGMAVGSFSGDEEVEDSYDEDTQNMVDKNKMKQIAMGRMLLAVSQSGIQMLLQMYVLVTTDVASPLATSSLSDSSNILYASFAISVFSMALTFGNMVIEVEHTGVDAAAENDMLSYYDEKEKEDDKAKSMVKQLFVYVRLLLGICFSLYGFAIFAAEYSKWAWMVWVAFPVVFCGYLPLVYMSHPRGKNVLAQVIIVNKFSVCVCVCVCVSSACLLHLFLCNHNNNHTNIFFGKK